MREPHDATLDVKLAIREIISEVEDLKKRWVQLNGSRLTGAQDAVTPTGLVTLRQLQDVQLDVRNLRDSTDQKIETLKLTNGLD